MTDIVNTAEIKVTADSSGVESGLRAGVDAANRAGQAIAQTGQRAGGAARAVESAQRNIIASIQRTTMAMEAGGRATANYYEMQGRQRNVDPASLTPYLNQLRAVEAAQAQATQATQAQAAAARELANAQATKESFLAGLREQIALFGKSTEEVLRYRAAQAGASQESAQLILQLQNMRAAQEQVAAAARAAAQAQREVAQADASRNTFLQGLREQIALFGLSTDEVNRYRAAQLGAASAADPLIAQLRDLRLAQEQQTYATRMEAQAQRELAQAQATRTSFMKGLEQQVAGIGKTRTEMLELQAAQLGVTTQAKPLLDQLRAQDQAFQNGGMSAAAMNAALRGVPAQMTDIIVSLQGGQAPLTVFLQQGGQLRDMFGSVGGAARALAGAAMGLINPYTVTIGLVATGAAAFKAGHDETVRYSRALIMTSNIAGTTAGQMADMAARMEEVNGSQAISAKTLATLASTGAIAGSNLEKFGTVAVDAQRVLGQSVEDTAKQFAALGKDPLTTLRSIGDQYGFVTTETYLAVKAAQEQGRMIEAASLAQNAYADGVAKQKAKVLETLGAWERGWINIKTAAGGAWDAVVQFASGRDEGPGEQVQGLEAQIAKQEERVKRLKAAGIAREGEGKYDPSKDRDVLGAEAIIAANKREIDSINERSAASTKAAADESKATQRQMVEREWTDKQKILLSRREQRENALAAAQARGTELGIPQATVEKQLMAIRREYNDVFVAGIDASMTALRKRAELEDVLTQRALAQIEAQRKAGAISEEDAIRRTAAQQIADMDADEARLKRQLALTSSKIGSERDQLDLQGQIASLSAQRVSRQIQLEDDLAEAQRNRSQASMDLYMQGVAAANAELDGLTDQVKAQQLANEEIGLSKAALADLHFERMNDAAAMKEQRAAALEMIEPGSALAETYRRQAEELRNLAASRREGAVKQDAFETNKKALDELNQFLDPARAQTFGDALREAFGSAGESISKMTAGLDGFAQRQAEIDKNRARAEALRNTPQMDEIKYLETISELNDRTAKNRLRGYGDMASAAKGFFRENTTGYKVMEGTEKAFRAIELANQMQSLYTHLFVTTAKATGTAAGQGVETAAVVAGEAARNTAKVPGVYMAFMSALGPWGMAAAGAAIAAVLGGAFSGGGGGGVPLSQQRQEKQGTGTVLGSDEQSESISRAIDAIEGATLQGLGISTDMLGSLRNIEAGIGQFASFLVQSTGVSGDYGAQFATKDGNFFSKLGSSIFGGKKTVEDTGFMMTAATFESILNGGTDAAQYADIKKSGGWFSSSKNSTQLEGLGADGNRQIANVLASLYQTVVEGAGLIGIGGDDFIDQLNSYVVDIGKVSLKDMSGAEIQEALSAVFSKVGDELAKYGVGGLDQFQKVGEGYLETLSRVATNYQAVTVVTDSMGMAFDSVGLSSVAARERLIGLVGGLDEFTASADQFLQDFYSDQERADSLRARITPTLDQFGIKTGDEDSLKQFRSVVTGLDLTTEAGARAYATLLQIAPAFKQIADIDAEALEKAADLANGKRELEIQIMDLLGDKSGALAASRAMELLEMDASLRPLQERVYALEDEATAVQAANARRSLEAQIMGLSGDKAGELAITRAIELAGMDALLRPLKERVFALQDEATAVQAANARRSLEAQILGLTGDKAGQLAITRALELAGMDAALLPLKERVYALQDEAAALQTANSLLDIQAQIYELSGDKAGAAAVLAQQHANALVALDPALREATEKLWGLQGAAKALELVKADGTKLMGIVDGAFSALQKVVERQKKAMQEEIDLRTKSVQKIEALSQSLRSTLDGMSVAGREREDRQAAQAQIQAALAIAKASGKLPSADDLKNALSIVSKDSSALFATQEDYLRDFYSTKNGISDLAGITDKSLSAEERSLKSLEDQVKQYDLMLEREQEQIDVLKGISVVGLSIEQAIQALHGALGAASRNPVNSATSAVSQAYQSALGRAPDQAGLEYWKDRAAGGISVEAIVGSIKGSPEAQIQTLYKDVFGRPADAAGLSYWMDRLAGGISLGAIKDTFEDTDEAKKKLRGFAVGTNYIPVDMPAMVHQGERIIPAADNRELMRRLASPTQSNELLVAEVRALREEVALLRQTNSDENYSIAKHAMNTASALDDALNGNKPLATKVVKEEATQ